MRIAVLALILAGCGGTYDTQCAGTTGINCEFVGLPICTSRFGDTSPHAFCTRDCVVDDDCGPDGVCAPWQFRGGIHSVCVSVDWTNH